MKKINSTRKKLADGFEDDILKQNFEIQVGGNKIEFAVKELYDSSFDELGIEKNEIEKNEKIIVNNFDGSYQLIEGLELLYMKKGNFFILFSYGEYQPARYLLYLEAIYSL